MTAATKMAGYNWLFLNLLVIVAAHDHTTTPVNMTIDGGYDVIIPTNCTIKFNETDVKLYRELTAESDNKLVYVHFHFTSHTGNLMFEYEGDLFEPLTWVYVSGHQGKSLLNLMQHYEALSLKTMSLGVEHMTIGIMESPNGCFTNQPMTVVGPYFRDTLLNNFGPSVDVNTIRSSKESLDEPTDKPISVSVCHMTIGKEENVARFFYTCCHNNHGVPVCKELTVDSYMQSVRIFIIIINILVIAFCPFLVPKYYYSDTTGCIRYKQKTKTERAPITILKTNVLKHSGSRNKIVTEGFVHEYMPKFDKTVENLTPDEPCECDIGTIEFLVKSRDLISESDVPVGICSTIYNNFARCEIKNHSSMQECCNADMLRFFGCSVQWYECLTRLMTTIVLVIVSIPWILRVIFYVTYEQNHFEGRATAAQSRQLSTPYLANLTLYFSPLHVVFLMCYFFIIIEGMCLGILHRNVTRSLRTVFRRCFKDMRRSTRLKSVGSLWKHLLYPCTKYGILGLILSPIVWIFVLPVCLIMSTFYYLPIVNLTCRLVWSLLYNLIPSEITNSCCVPKTRDSEKLDSEQSRGVNCLIKLRHVFLTLFCLLALYSFLLLLVEFVQFVVVIVIYTLMGIILNSSVAMQYVPLFFMVAVYGHTTFGGVYKKYMCFNKIIHKHVMDIFKRTSSIAELELMNSRSNMAFEVNQEANENSSKDFLYIKNSKCMWSSRRTVLFVNKHGTPFIRKEFFLECCNMDHFAAPGNLASNLMKAVFKFLVTMCFLVFVGLVVLAFSENFELSSTNQTLIALAGGLIPFVLTNFLFRKVELPQVDDDLRFARNLTKIISTYKETFDVVDFKCVNVCKEYADSDTQTDTETQNSNGTGQQNGTAPKSAETNGQMIQTQNDVDQIKDIRLGSSPGQDTIIEYADESDNLQNEEQSTNQTNNELERHMRNQHDEHSIQNGHGEITKEQPIKVALPTSNGQPKRDQNSPNSQSSSFSVDWKAARQTRDLSNYDIVIDTSKPLSVAHYLISLI